MHIFCPKCGKDVKSYEDNIVYKCKLCRNIYCNNHILYRQCTNCLYRNEYKIKRSSIQIALNKFGFYHENIIKWITEYCMGYTIKCGISKVDNCYGDIIIENQFQFNSRKVFLGRTFIFLINKMHQNSITIYKSLLVCGKCDKL